MTRKTSSSSLPFLLLGGGGHARVVLDLLQERGDRVLGFLSPDDTCSSFYGLPRLGGDEILGEWTPDQVALANGVGSVGDPGPRVRVFEECRCRGFRFPPLISVHACISSWVVLEEGVQVHRGVLIQGGTRIGENTLVNTGAMVDHDCDVGEHVHLAPGCVLSGGVRVGARTHLGTGAVVIQGIRIGEDVLVAAGAVVTGDVADARRVRGIPARENERGGLS